MITSKTKNNKPKANLQSKCYHLTKWNTYSSINGDVDIKEEARQFVKKLLKLGFNAVDYDYGRDCFSVKSSGIAVPKLPTYTFYYDIPVTHVRIAVQISLRGKGEVNFSLYSSEYICTEELVGEEGSMEYIINKCGEASHPLNSLRGHDYTPSGEFKTWIITDSNEPCSGMDYIHIKNFDCAWYYYMDEVCTKVGSVSVRVQQDEERLNELLQEFNHLQPTCKIGLYNTSH